MGVEVLMQGELSFVNKAFSIFKMVSDSIEIRLEKIRIRKKKDLKNRALEIKTQI